jgi:mRNA-degrading endonuclease RelE of RelBE toxin-antitoxin system
LETGEIKYQVIITKPAEIYFYEILEYLYENYSFERAEEIADSIRNKVLELQVYPEKGTIEPRLTGRMNQYKFILFNRLRMKDIKIIYFINYEKKIVYVTDFFPTEKDDQKITKRN